METSLLKQMATIFLRAQNSIVNLTVNLGSFQNLLVFLCRQRVEFTNFVKETFHKILRLSIFLSSFLIFFSALKERIGIPASDHLLD